MLEVAKVLSGQAIINFNEVKHELEEQLKKYKGYVLDDVKVAKDDRATLNKAKKEIEDKRKEVKKMILQTYDNDIEPKFKELVGMIDECCLAIDGQIKKIEEQEKAERDKEIQNLWKEFNYNDVDLRRIIDPKWYNKGTTLKMIQTDMQNIINEIKLHCLELREVGGEELVSNYLFTLDAELSMNEWKFKQERKGVKTEVHKPTGSSKLYQVELRIKGTKDALHLLGQWLRQNGYVFEQTSDLDEL